MTSALSFRLRYSLLAILVAATLSFWGHAAKAIVYGGIGGRPAFPQSDNPRTEDIFIHTLTPGSVQEEGVRVLNNTSTQRTLMVYAADSTPSSDGGFACKQLADQQTDVGTWILFGDPKTEDAATTEEQALSPKKDEDGDGLTNSEEEDLGSNPRKADTDGDGVSDKDERDANTNLRSPMVVTLESGTNILVPFTITVPENADTGEQNGCILIQEKTDPTQAAQEGIALSTRTGIRVALTIPGDITRGLEITDFLVLPREQGGKILHPVVRNTGNVSVDADVQVVTKNVFGQVVKAHGGQYAVLRGDTSQWNFELSPQYWGGWFRSTLTVRYNTQDATEASATASPDTVLTFPVQTYFLPPSRTALIVYGAGLMLVLSILAMLWIARKRKLLIAKTWVSYKAHSGDSVKSLAEKMGVSWKLLAKTNKLRPPYELASGQELRVPPTQTGKAKKAPSVKSSADKSSTKTQSKKSAPPKSSSAK